jgi:hypothetical protein
MLRGASRQIAEASQAVTAFSVLCNREAFAEMQRRDEQKKNAQPR